MIDPPNRLTKDTMFMSLAYLTAMRSPDDSTKIGAVVVGPDDEVRSMGYNGLPRGCDDFDSNRHEKPEKYYWFEHSERNSIYAAARMGTPLKGCRMYTQDVPCADCARAIIQSGIVEVIVHEQFSEFQDNNKWVESKLRTLTMFDECGISLREWVGEIPQMYGRKNNQFVFGDD